MPRPDDPTRPEGEPTPEEIYRYAARLREPWDQRRLAEQEGSDREVVTPEVKVGDVLAGVGG